MMDFSGKPIRIANGDVSRVGTILDELGAKSIFLVTQTEAYEGSGASAIIEPFLSHRKVTRFTDFEPNPKLPDTERALKSLKANPCDAVIAVGGGSAIDMAKLVCAFAAQPGSPEEVISELPKLNPKQLPLIAVPTTAGTGSEATHFAVIYVGEKKYSIPHLSLLPDYAIVDPELTHSLPRNIAAVTGLDALCQGIESLWSVQSTKESRSYAREAIQLSWNHLETSVLQAIPESRFAMCQASYLAGRAINISKTTAPHAISYCITSRCGIPHGHAVALTLGSILIFNSQVSSADINDPRGVTYVKSIVGELLQILDCETPVDASKRIAQLMKSIGCETRLSELGINFDDLRQYILENVNLERLKNNPRTLGKEPLNQLLESIA
jgi:alcohol dehydrogenase class IV